MAVPPIAAGPFTMAGLPTGPAGRSRRFTEGAPKCGGRNHASKRAVDGVERRSGAIRRMAGEVVTPATAAAAVATTAVTERVMVLAIAGN